ncbi:MULTISPECIES: helix-turn-helix domain-containing protein [unclassified Nocardia]|uniref:TetR/AcrR family transcriptional regulator n=1 Tax=unclassified Nocardia TaxID=2637762 RepID=UPI0027DFBB8A|nr:MULTISPECIES: helix-turn-helix domain-containing protein [unclassified Nocardia]
MNTAGRTGPESTAPKRRMSATDRRAQLLDVARDIVGADGFGAVTIERVAREADVARALVYQQFTDLNGLMTALLDRETGIALSGVSSVDWAADTIDQVAEGILAYLHAAPTSWQIMLSPPDGGPPNLRARLELGRSYARAVGARHLSRFAGVEVDPNGPTERILLAALEELARLHLDNPQRYPDEVVLHYIRELVGWAAGVEARRPR